MASVTVAMVTMRVLPRVAVRTLTCVDRCTLRCGGPMRCFSSARPPLPGYTTRARQGIVCQSVCEYPLINQEQRSYSITLPNVI